MFSGLSVICGLCLIVDCILAAPGNVSDVGDVISLQESLNLERAERLRLQTELDSLSEKFSALESNFHMQRDRGWLTSKSGVSFTAVRSANVNIYPKQTLIFDEVLSNVGDVYNPTFGHFTAPVDGVYLISVSIAVQHQKLADVYLMNNTTEVYRFLAGDATSNWYEVGSATLNLELAKGDVLYIQGRRSPDYILGTKMTSFSGVLL